MVSLENYKWYLAAMIDGEGSVLVKNSTVTITNTDLSIINFCCLSLDEVGIKYTLGNPKRPYNKDHWKPIYVIYMCGRSNLEKIYKEIPIKCDKKYTRLKEINEKPILRLQRDSWPIEDIIKIYEEGYSCRQVGEKLGISSKMVIHYMRKTGYPRRTNANKPKNI